MGSPPGFTRRSPQDKEDGEEGEGPAGDGPNRHPPTAVGGGGGGGGGGGASSLGGLIETYASKEEFVYSILTYPGTESMSAPASRRRWRRSGRPPDLALGSIDLDLALIVSFAALALALALALAAVNLAQSRAAQPWTSIFSADAVVLDFALTVAIVLRWYA